MKRLLIVVPYRDRAEHLAEFIPHVRSYFARHYGARIPYRSIIVEQEAGLPFNGGAVRNIGFLLGREGTDYTSFHDVDYLPIDADYSWTEGLTPIVWYGARRRKIAPGRHVAVVKHDLNSFFGGVILVPNHRFQEVDGYANDYWGWGNEDVDLAKRFAVRKIPIERRRGRFKALDHDHRGFRVDGTLMPSAQANRRLFEQRWFREMGTVQDGLSTVRFDVLSRGVIPEVQSDPDATWEIATVRLHMQPPREYLEEFDGLKA